MPQPHQRLTVTLFTAAVLAAIFSADKALVTPARAAERGRADSPAEDALTPQELDSLKALSSGFRKLARLVRPGVVQIKVEATKAPEPDPAEVERLRLQFGKILSEDQIQEMARIKPAASGSGIILDEQGHIVTNSHVVKERDEIKVRLSDEHEYPAKLIGIDTKTDVAVIQIDAPDLHPLTFADSSSVEVGDWVLAVGAPFGLTQTVTHGIISATGRGHVQGLDKIYYQNFIQTDAAINPGNSGGPLLSMRGEVLGINTAIATNDDRNAGVAFAIPSNMTVKVARTLIEKGVVARGWLGISFVSTGVTATDVEIIGLPNDRGVLVASVLAKSPAQSAGLEVDDYLTAVNGQDLGGAEQFSIVIGDFQPDEQLSLQVLRDGQPRELTVTLGRQPDDPQDQSLSENAEIGRAVPQLGLSGRALRPKVRGYEADDRGILVTDVDKDGPCTKAVRPGDVITAFNDHKIRNLAELSAELKAVTQNNETAPSAGPRKIRMDVLQSDGDMRLEKITPR